MGRCPLCGREFRSRWALHQHLRSLALRLEGLGLAERAMEWQWRGRWRCAWRALFPPVRGRVFLGAAELARAAAGAGLGWVERLPRGGRGWRLARARAAVLALSANGRAEFTAAEVARRAGLSPQAAGQLLRALAREGLVETAGVRKGRRWYRVRAPGSG
jgi:DNA-binding transcriptional ArsR family regulator